MGLSSADAAAHHRRRREHAANLRAQSVAQEQGNNDLAARIAARERAAAANFIARFGAAQHAQITQTTAA